MNVVPIKDEIPARKKMLQFIKQYPTPMQVVAQLDTVDKAIDYLRIALPPDLIFPDIELLDGNAFEVYKTVAPPCPVIFTTAYREFLLDASGNSDIGYLLKPFDYDPFAQTIGQYESLRRNFQDKQRDLMHRVETWMGESQAVRYETCSLNQTRP